MTFGGHLTTRGFDLTLVACALALVGCGPQSQSIKIDGSSTVHPINEAVAESFREVQPRVRVTLSSSGTGGGMKMFTAGEIDICGASRGIKAEEDAALKEAKVPYTEIKVALDGIVVVVNPANDWCDTLTVEQLSQVWRPLDDDPAQKWSDLNPEWPDEPLKLYGPGTDSGTFDYFTEAVNGEEKVCRSDFTASEDDNVLVTGVSEDKHALGYFGYAYYAENADKLKVLSIAQADSEPVTPSVETIRSNAYRPLSRPLFIYVRNDLLKRPSGAEFLGYYLEQAGKLAEEVGYVPVSDEEAAENRQKYDAAVGG